MCVLQANTGAVRDWLRLIDLRLHGPSQLKVSLSTAGLCAAQESLMRDLHAMAGTQPCVTLTYAMTLETMAALRTLPDCIKQIDLTGCTWPLQPDTYKHLAWHIPLGISKWVLGAVPQSSLSRRIIAGIRERRQGLGLPRLHVQLGTSGGVLWERKEELVTVIAMQQGFNVQCW